MARRKQRRFDGKTLLMHRFPDVDEDHATALAADIVGVDQRQVYRWMADGLTPYKADELACALGFHPSLVWGDAWRQAALDDTKDLPAEQEALFDAAAVGMMNGRRP